MQVLHAFLASKLATLTRHFENDLSVCGVVLWLLQLHLEDVHVAALRAEVSPEAAAEPALQERLVCALLRRYHAVIDYRSAVLLFGQHGHPRLQLFAMELYGRHVDAFHLTLPGTALMRTPAPSTLPAPSLTPPLLHALAPRLLRLTLRSTFTSALARGTGQAHAAPRMRT
jgi:hypothetical protein